jgi:hypothetical protein
VSVSPSLFKPILALAESKLGRPRLSPLIDFRREAERPLVPLMDAHEGRAMTIAHARERFVAGFGDRGGVRLPA